MSYSGCELEMFNLNLKDTCLAERIRLRLHTSLVSVPLSVCGSLCVKKTEEEVLEHFPWGHKTETSVSGSTLTHPSLPQYTYTLSDAFCSYQVWKWVKECESRGVKERTLSTKLTGELTMIDKDKQWNYVQTPTLLKDNTSLSLTHTHTTFTPASQTAHPLKDTHIHVSFGFNPPPPPPSLPLRDNGRVSHTSGAELAVASSPCQGKQS